MRHRKAGRKLGRNASHRLALKRNLALALIRHERIVTTLEKAKELRPFVEKLITLARKGTLHARRLAIARLGPCAEADVAPEDDENTQTVLRKLFDEIGPRFKDRPGGYTRVIKRHERRLGDAGRTAYIELLRAGETKVRTRAPAPVPRVTEPAPETPTAPAPAPSTPPASEAPAPHEGGEPPTE
jgi:large subunit ribosomal protein L17